MKLWTLLMTLFWLFKILRQRKRLLTSYVRRCDWLSHLFAKWITEQTSQILNGSLQHDATITEVLPLQERRNVTQSERDSESLISFRVKTNLSTMDFYEDLCFPRPGESSSVYKLHLRKKERF